MQRSGETSTKRAGLKIRNAIRVENVPKAITASTLNAGPLFGNKFIQRAEISVAKFSRMDPSNVLVKNTFIQVDDKVDDGYNESELPRAFSDQSHVRKAFEKPVPIVPVFPPIIESSHDSVSERSSSIQRLDSEELERLRTLSRPNVDNRIVFGLPGSGMSFLAPTPQNQSFVAPMNSIVHGHLDLPPIGDHKWHDESSSMGTLSAGKKEFTKVEYDGRLSMVTESLVHREGTQRYLVYITEGPVSVADGFGFVFSASLPCKKNIQKIDSIFLNRKGRICSRSGNELEILNSSSIGMIEVGSIVEIIVNLDNLETSFALYSPPVGVDTETLSILVRDDKTFSNWMTGSSKISMKSIVERSGRAGHFCAVLKNKHTTVRFL